MTVKTETFHSDFVVARFRSACLMKWLQHKHGFNQEDGSDVYGDSRLRYTIRCLCDQRTCRGHRYPYQLEALSQSINSFLGEAFSEDSILSAFGSKQLVGLGGLLQRLDGNLRLV